MGSVLWLSTLEEESSIRYGVSRLVWRVVAPLVHHR